MDTSNVNEVHILIAMLLFIAWFVANAFPSAAYQSKLDRIRSDVNAQLSPNEPFPTAKWATKWEHRRQYKRLLMEYRRLFPNSGVIEEMRNLHFFQILLFMLSVASMYFLFFDASTVLLLLILTPLAVIDNWLLHKK